MSRIEKSNAVAEDKILKINNINQLEFKDISETQN